MSACIGSSKLGCQHRYDPCYLDTKRIPKHCLLQSSLFSCRRKPKIMFSRLAQNPKASLQWMHWHWLRPVPKRLIFTIKLTHHTENTENSRFQAFKGWLGWRNEIGWKEKSRPPIDRTGLHFCTTHHPPMTTCLADKQVLTLLCNKRKRWWCASKQLNILMVAVKNQSREHQFKFTDTLMSSTCKL